MQRRWNNVNSIYQIYPRSFQDSDGDGVGDLAGILQRLDYVKGDPLGLGVDAIWLSPFYASPMKDFGYDVSDHTAVDPLFGTMDDFDQLIEQAHQRGIKVMIDFVPNHTSSEHQWFQEALRDRHSAKRDFYIFRDPAPGGGPPNNWLSVFGGPAWTLDEQSGQYYLHSFLKEQPDLNWRNPEVRHEMQQVIRFWLDRGVDGLRVDAVRWMGKNPDFLNDPINDSFREGDNPYDAVRPQYSRYSAELVEYLRSMTEVLHDYDDTIIIFEDHIDNLSSIEAQVRHMYAIDPGYSAPFNFQGIRLPFEARAFAAMVRDFQACVPPIAQAFYCLSNHDEPRLVRRVGQEQARLLGALQLLLPGIPVIYYGQELGMDDTDLEKSDMKDPYQFGSRDAQRTPMQWDASAQAGFSAADHTWLPVAPDFRGVNVSVQQQDRSSSFWLYKQLMSLRQAHPVFQHGSYQQQFIDDELYVFMRSDATESVTVFAHFGNNLRDVSYPIDGEVLVSTHEGSRVGQAVNGRFSLRPFQLIAVSTRS